MEETRNEGPVTSSQHIDKELFSISLIVEELKKNLQARIREALESYKDSNLTGQQISDLLTVKFTSMMERNLPEKKVSIKIYEDEGKASIVIPLPHILVIPLHDDNPNQP